MDKMQTIIYKYIKEWCKGADSQEVAADGRTMVSLVLGEYRCNGTTQDYIVEPIYENVLEDIISNAKNYEIKVQLNVIPQLTVIANGFIVQHNDAVAGYIRELQDVLKQIDDETIMDAYLELRLNMNGKSKLNAATDILMAKIEKISGKKYCSLFVRAVINTVIEHRFFSTEDNELKEWLRSLDYVDLVGITNVLLRYKLDQVISDEMLMQLCQESRKETAQFMKGVEIVLGQELILRLFKGVLATRQTLGR